MLCREVTCKNLVFLQNVVDKTIADAVNTNIDHAESAKNVVIRIYPGNENENVVYHLRGIQIYRTSPNIHGLR